MVPIERGIRQIESVGGAEYNGQTLSLQYWQEQKP